MADPRAVPGESARETSDPEPLAFPRAGGRLSYVDEGPRDAPVFITLHGIPGSVRDFRYLAPLLSPWLRLVRVDLPGFGGSTPDEAATRSVQGRSQAVLDLADHLGVRRFGLVGHSMGGAPALLLGARARERVSHLVLLASVGLRRHRGLHPSPRAFRFFGRVLGWPIAARLLTPLARSAYRRRRFPGADQMTSRDFAVQLRSIGALDFGVLRQAVAEGLPPTLVAFCHDDPLLEAAVAEDLAQHISGARRLAFATGGHNLQKTRAPEVAAAILEMVGS